MTLRELSFLLAQSRAARGQKACFRTITVIFRSAGGVAAVRGGGGARVREVKSL